VAGEEEGSATELGWEEVSGEVREVTASVRLKGRERSREGRRQPGALRFVEWGEERS
jgi:hypothetical protein